jgi:hypothetical protein
MFQTGTSYLNLFVKINRHSDSLMMAAKSTANRSRNLIGTRVRQARIAHKPEITQSDLSARLTLLGLHIGRAAISKIEGGTREVTDVELVAISECLRVSPAWLLGTEAPVKRGRA